MAIRTFNSVAGFSVGEDPKTIILANGDISTTNIGANANVAAGNLLTDNLLYANGQPWDLQDPAGSNGYIQFNSNEDFGASANLTYDTTTNVLLVNATANINTLQTSNITSATTNADITIEPNGTGIVKIPESAGGAVGIEIGTPSKGNLTSNAVTFDANSSVSDGIAQLNEVLGKLVPPAPPAFPASQSITIASLSSYRMTSLTQTDNTGASQTVLAGNTVLSVRRSASYSTSTIANAGPGTSGTVKAFLNGVDVGNITLTKNMNGNGTYGGNLVITNNFDYRNANANIAANFWGVFSASLSGNVTAGWNQAKIVHTGAGNTNTVTWYYDSSSPGTPQITNTTIAVQNSPAVIYTSTVPHYTSSTQFNLTFDVNKLSGDMYPTTDNFVTGSSGGAFQTPSSVSYSTAGVTTPLAQNLYVSSGNVTVTTTANIVNGFGNSSAGPSVSVINSYNTGTGSFNPGATVLYKTGTTSLMEETAITNTLSVTALRIVNPGSSDTPAVSSTTAFNSQNATLETYDATIVGGTLKHDITNYSTGYLPVGPNLSSGRSGAQYFTFKFAKASVSKFGITITGAIAGLWVKLPGSTLDSTSSLNGWLDLSISYSGSGKPGANTGSGGNGSNGAALGTPVTLGSSSTQTVNATFGTESSSNATSNEILVRIKLNSGQTVSALSLGASTQ